MINAGLDSLVLSPFSDTYESSDKPEFLPTTDAPLDSHSQEYNEKLVAALSLDSDSYSHVDPDIMQQFKQYLHEFPTAFLLPNSPLTTIKGFEHTVDTGNAQPVYKPPYRKSPQELRAVRDEIERMLKLKIIEPSNSEWGAPCIPVRKPVENGQVQPPRFVVDYRGLNAITKDDGYVIPTVANCYI